MLVFQMLLVPVFFVRTFKSTERHIHEVDKVVGGIEKRFQTSGVDLGRGNGCDVWLNVTKEIFRAVVSKKLRHKISVQKLRYFVRML